MEFFKYVFTRFPSRAPFNPFGNVGYISSSVIAPELFYCLECSEYPCKLTINLEKSYNKRYQASLIENSRFVEAHGLECFMEQQKAKYTCPKCGGIISIHDRECSECQEKMV